VAQRGNLILDSSIAAYTFCAFTAFVVVFQLALALGAPWGELAMGGKFPGRFPPKMRVAALVQIVLLVAVAFIVLIRAGLLAEEYYDISRPGIWFVVVLFVVSTILNTITPSKKERMMGAPIAAVLLVSSIIVAMS